jgi:hypothetical protein
VLRICHCDLLASGGLAEGNMRRVTGVDGGVGSTGGGRWAEEVGGGCKVIREIFTWGTVLQLYAAWSRVKM